MKKITITGFMVLIAGLVFTTGAFATPTTEYWTTCIIDVQGFGVPHLGIDNYYTVDNRANGGSAFPTDVGLTIGVLPFDKVQMEVGADGLYPSKYPYFFNAKIGTPEDSIVKGSPGFAVGIFDVGTEPTVTGYDIGDVIIGKTIPYVGRLHLGYYYGNHGMLLDSNGNPDNQGWMIAFDRTIWSIGKSWMDSIVLMGDYASGNNAIGGGGFGLSFNFTNNMDVITGPVWFNAPAINGDWKWTTQLDVNF